VSVIPPGTRGATSAMETPLLRAFVPLAWIVSMPLAILRRLGENGRLGDRASSETVSTAWRAGRGSLLAPETPPARTAFGSAWFATRRVLRRVTGVSRSTP